MQAIMTTDKIVFISLSVYLFVSLLCVFGLQNPQKPNITMDVELYLPSLHPVRLLQCLQLLQGSLNCGFISVEI
jgi:hypothetical protein